MAYHPETHETEDLMALVLAELEKLNKHMALITDVDIDDDTGD